MIVLIYEWGYTKIKYLALSLDILNNNDKVQNIFILTTLEGDISQPFVWRVTKFVEEISFIYLNWGVFIRNFGGNI